MIRADALYDGRAARAQWASTAITARPIRPPSVAPTLGAMFMRVGDGNGADTYPRGPA
jgi:hypothetical protein